MILHVARIQDDQPRISSNQLGEYIFASPKKKMSILHNQKYGNPVCAPYYSSALRGIIRSFQNGVFSQDVLVREMEQIVSKEAETVYSVSKRTNNVQAVESFINMGEAVNPPMGMHRIISRNARVVIDGVAISARPEIITEESQLGYAAFTKLRISKSKVSADAQEIVLLILLHYGQQQSHDGLVFSMERTRLIDCFSQTIIAGHTISRHRDQQLHQALIEIRTLWPNV